MATGRRDDRLWFAHWGVGEIVTVDLDGASEVVGHGPQGFGWSLEWLPDGRLLVTGEGLSRREADGSMVPHADLSALSGDWNEIVVDGRGNIYLNGRCEFNPGEHPEPAARNRIAAPDGRCRARLFAVSCGGSGAGVRFGAVSGRR